MAMTKRQKDRLAEKIAKEKRRAAYAPGGKWGDRGLAGAINRAFPNLNKKNALLLEKYPDMRGPGYRSSSTNRSTATMSESAPRIIDSKPRGPIGKKASGANRMSRMIDNKPRSRPKAKYAYDYEAGMLKAIAGNVANIGRPNPNLKAKSTKVTSGNDINKLFMTSNEPKRGQTYVSSAKYNVFNNQKLEGLSRSAIGHNYRDAVREGKRALKRDRHTAKMIDYSGKSYFGTFYAQGGGGPVPNKKGK